MILRRHILVSSVAALAAAASVMLPFAAYADGFDDFVDGVKGEARRAGVSDAVLSAAFDGVRPNQTILDKINHQAEFTMSWAEYRAKVVNDKRIAAGRAAYAGNQRIFEAVRARYNVDPGILLGIWGVESDFGGSKGTFSVIESLSTLAWGSHRQAFFRSELIAALKILQHGDITPERMVGSFAGAMGQPQFMPSSYLRLAVDFDGDGRRDIWDNNGDAIASIANYLARSGWQGGQPWGMPVQVPENFASDGRDDQRSLSDWMRLGVRKSDGSGFLYPQAVGAVVQPDGAGGEAFLVFANFAAIRRYNASDFYALAVGLIGNQIVGA